MAYYYSKSAVRINKQLLQGKSRSLLLDLRVTLSVLFWWHAAVLCYSDVCWIIEMCCRCITLTPRINVHESAVPSPSPNCVTVLHCFRHHVSPTPGLVGNVPHNPQCHDSPVNKIKYVASKKSTMLVDRISQENLPKKLISCQCVLYKQSILLKERSSHPSGWSTLGSHCYSLGY